MSESDLHKAVARLLDIVIPRSGCLWWHTPNGGSRRKRTSANGKTFSPEALALRAMGVRPGIPDITILMQGGRSAFLELKGHGGSLSPAQRDVIPRLQHLGAPVYVCRSLDHVRVALIELGLWSSELDAIPGLPRPVKAAAQPTTAPAAPPGTERVGHRPPNAANAHEYPDEPVPGIHAWLTDGTPARLLGVDVVVCGEPTLRRAALTYQSRRRASHPSLGAVWMVDVRVRGAVETVACDSLRAAREAA